MSGTTMSDGESTQKLINELFDIDCSIDDAIELEMVMFTTLRKQVKDLGEELLEIKQRTKPVVEKLRLMSIELNKLGGDA
jgi:archaellum component FlaC